ncbi:MAG: hypothetical protein E6I91_08685 [Chloroflexi bacterium]|nr:MAG: hypothetical protein E6I91_08685 [Chloroflexota bacterium]
MFPNTLHQFLLIQEWLREQERRYRPQELRKVHRVNIWQHLLGHLNAFLTKPGASKQQCTRSIPLEVAVSEEERLSQNGFTDEEIVALFRLRQWYHMGGREQNVMLRHWEFLKMLVNKGKLEA